jgi:replication factor C small subunit
MSVDVRKRLWVEKYKPETIEDVILPKHYKDKFIQFITEKDCPNMILTGDPGGGKTTCAKMIAEAITEDWLFMNASSETSIDSVRNKIQPFCRAMSVDDSGLKIVVLDEVDGASTNFQHALKENIEKFYGSTRFIMTSNNPHNIDPAIHSRCQKYEFGEVDKKVLAKRLYEILKTEGVKFDGENLKNIIKSIGGDIRKCLVELQKLTVDGVLTPFVSSDVKHIKIMELLKQKELNGIRKYISEEGVNYDGILKYMLDHAQELGDEWPSVMIDISDVAYRIKVGVDEDIAFSAGLINIMEKI